ncbi:MAG: ABC transporter permease [Deltaproteobacteria bacterium]|nr:ABC transporter permease [Deltaproteobacteria bacterium]
MNTAPASAPRTRYRWRWSLALTLAPALLWLFLLILLPHLELLLMSLQRREGGVTTWTLLNYAAFFTEPIYWITYLRTALYAILTTVLTLLVAFPAAFFLTKVVRLKYQGFLLMLLMLSFWVSELVRTYGWIILLRESGVLNHFLVSLGVLPRGVEMLYNDAAIMIGLVYSSLLFMVVPIVSTLEGMDDSYIEAAHNLGANGWTIMRRIVVPYAMPGIVSGSIVVFMLNLGNYLVPNLLGGKNSLWFTEQIYNRFIIRLDWEQGSAFGFLLLALSSFIVWGALRLTGQNLSKVIQ